MRCVRNEDWTFLKRTHENLQNSIAYMQSMHSETFAAEINNDFVNECIRVSIGLSKELCNAEVKLAELIHLGANTRHQF